MRIEEYSEFLTIADELLQDERIWSMQNYIQHGSVSCLEHSFVVSYYCYTLIKRLHVSCDERALVRGALLHDYFLYDWHEPEAWHRLHGFLFLRTAMQFVTFKSVSGNRRLSESICGL